MSDSSLPTAQDELVEKCANLLDLRAQDIRLIAGEMSAQEIRSVRAMLNERARAIRALKQGAAASEHPSSPEVESASPQVTLSDELHRLRRLVKAYERGNEMSWHFSVEAARQQGIDNGRLVIMERALQSIAKNTCCEGCQEAARVASKALDEELRLFNERSDATPSSPDILELVEALDEARLQIEYLHERSQTTSSGVAVLSRIEGALSRFRGQK